MFLNNGGVSELENFKFRSDAERRLYSYLRAWGLTDEDICLEIMHHRKQQEIFNKLFSFLALLWVALFAWLFYMWFFVG